MRNSVWPELSSTCLLHGRSSRWAALLPLGPPSCAGDGGHRPVSPPPDEAFSPAPRLLLGCSASVVCNASFLWMRPGYTPGARPLSLVNWSSVYRPREFGGLGIFELETFGRAMRLWWSWFAWTDPSKPWCDVADMELFRGSTDISTGRWGQVPFMA